MISHVTCGEIAAPTTTGGWRRSSFFAGVSVPTPGRSRDVLSDGYPVVPRRSVAAPTVSGRPASGTHHERSAMT